MMFKYDIILEANIDGRAYEFHKDWRASVQLREGDTVYIDGLEGVAVKSVVWYIDKPATAFVELEDVKLIGPADRWECLYGDCGFDASSPPLPTAAPQSAPSSSPWPPSAHGS
jgi:hypothetical protein